MVWRIIGVIGAILSIGGIFYAQILSGLLERWGVLGLSSLKIGMEKVNKVRFLAGFVFFLSLLLILQIKQIIIGVICMGIGFLLIKYSVSLHRILGSGGPGSAWFKGDMGIKILGLGVMIFGVVWMTGIIQSFG